MAAVRYFQPRRFLLVTSLKQKTLGALGVLTFVCSCSSTDGERQVGLASADGGPHAATGDAGSDVTRVNPEFDSRGALVRPKDWAEWVFLGSAVNLSYGSATPPPTDTLSAVYMEPTAYRHFETAGEFREGTMTVVTAYATDEAGAPALGGTVPTNLVAFEMSVKDLVRHPEGWGYYHFDTSPAGIGDTALSLPRSECFDCHDQHAETDHVFTQYYPALP
jgi:hypothetical protein